ncbi:hypothetical protein HK102_011126 [Quaeritorhiza haematococci]|nr:hypothetical protein HK102_011126 [Quaeritorhiza haematococci]
MGLIGKLLGTNEAMNAHSMIYQPEHHHKSELSHEVIAGAAGYEAMKAYERRCAEFGAPQSHEKMKEILSGIAAAEADKLFETKGLDYLDRGQARRMAAEQANRLAEEQYGLQNPQPTGYFSQQVSALGPYGGESGFGYGAPPQPQGYGFGYGGQAGPEQMGGHGGQGGAQVYQGSGYPGYP